MKVKQHDNEGQLFQHVQIRNTHQHIVLSESFHATERFSTNGQNRFTDMFSVICKINFDNDESKSY